MKKIFTLAALMLSMAAVAQKGDTLRTHKIEPVLVSSLRTPLQKSDIPNVVTVVGQQQIEASSATSLAEIVKTFTVTESADIQGLSNGMEFRAFGVPAFPNTTYTVMLRDGVRMGTRRAGMTSVEGISSVEILKGPFSAVYGSGAMGGIVNVNTVQSKGVVGGSANLSYGSYNTFGANAAAGGSLSEKVDFDISIDYLARGDDYRTGKHTLMKDTGYDLIVLDRNAYDTIYRNTTFDKTQGVLRLGVDLSSRWRLNLYNDLYYTGNAAANGTLWGTDMIDTRSIRNYHRLDVTGREGRHSLRLSPFIGFESTHNDDISMTGERDSDYNTFGVLAQDAIDFDLGTLVVGVDNLSERYNSERTSEAGEALSPFQPDYLNSQTGVFAQFNFTAMQDRLSGFAGVRYDNILLKTYKTAHISEVEPSSRNYNTFNPNLSLQFRLLEHRSLRLHVGAGRAFLAPDAFKLLGDYGYDFDGSGWVTRYKGNPDLKPETSVTLEAGVAYTSPSRTLDVDLTLFSTDHRNLVGTTSGDGYTTYVNADRAEFRGLEATGSFDLGAALDKKYSWRFFGSWMRIFHDEVHSGDIVAPRKYLSRSKMTLGTEFVLKNLTLAAQGRYVGEKIEDNYIMGYDAMWNPIPLVTSGGAVVREGTFGDALVTTPDYAVIDLSASYRLPCGVTVGVKVANVLDELYMERDGYYLPGRNFTFSLGYRF